MQSDDVVIIGGGVMGASAAFWLTRLRPRLRVRVCEADPTYARAATALSVASVRQQFTTPLNVRISRFGIGFIRDFAEHVGAGAAGGSLGLQENGYLFLAGSETAAATMRDAAQMQRAEGAHTELLTPKALARRFGWMQLDDVVLGAFGPRDEGWFDNMGLLNGLRDAARAQGARFEAARVAGLELRNGQVAGVQLQDGTRCAAGAVVVAAGTGTPALLQTAGLSVPVEARKRTVFVIDAPNARYPEAPLLVDHTGFYLRPERDHWITATVPQDDAAVAIDDFEPDHEQFEEIIWPRLYARAPGFDAVKVMRFWVGHYDYNLFDQNAIVGPHPDVAGLHLLTGFSGHGLQQAPALGRGLAERLLTGRYQTLDLTPLEYGRISAGQPYREDAVV